jgi:hypothetical protein
MEQSCTTVCFDGQFWMALVEKADADGNLSVGKYTFGAEPTNNDLLSFMLDRYALVPVYPSDVRVRVRARKSIREQERSTGKAKLAFKESQRAYFMEKKKDASLRRESDARRRYGIRQEKKKEKRRGH